MSQGSILEPILYIIYAKHRKTKLAIFADDTATYSHSWKSQAVKKVKKQAEDLEIYSENSQTKINSVKTEFIIFTHKKKEATPENIRVFDANIQRSDCVKYFIGVKLDSKLNFNNHVESTIAEVSKAIGVLYPFLGKINKYGKFQKQTSNVQDNLETSFTLRLPCLGK